MRMKRGVLLVLLSILVLAGASASEEWRDDADRAGRYYRAGDYDAAWLFYERALSRGCDDGLVVYYAAESFERQVLTENPEFGTALFAVARFFLQEQYPDNSALAATEEYADIEVNRRYLRDTYAVVGARAPKAKQPLAGFAGRAAGFFMSRIEDLGQFFTLLTTEGLREAFAWAKDNAWRLLLAWILVNSLTGIVLPVVMAVTVAREGRKSYVTAYAFLLHWGPLGIHRFYLGRYVSGVIWLLTGGLLGVGVFFDFFLTGAYVRFWNEDHRDMRPGSRFSGGVSPRSRGERAPKGPKRQKKTKTSAPKKARRSKPPKPPKQKTAKAPKGRSISSEAAAAGGGLAAAASAAVDQSPGGDGFDDIGGDDDFADLPNLDDLSAADASGDGFSFDNDEMTSVDQSSVDFESELPPELDDDDFDIGSLG